jgi:hypothetical protein
MVLRPGQMMMEVEDQDLKARTDDDGGEDQDPKALTDDDQGQCHRIKAELRVTGPLQTIPDRSKPLSGKVKA